MLGNYKEKDVCFNSRENNWIKKFSLYDVLRVHGLPGSGKTTLAFYFFGIFENCVMQLINQNFVRLINKRLLNELKNMKNKGNFIYWKSYDVKNHLEKNAVKFLIIDEYQRSFIKIFKEIIDICKFKKIKVILLGDPEQAIKPSDDSKFMTSELVQYCTKISLSIDKKPLVLKDVYRINLEALKMIQYLFLSNKGLPSNKSSYDIVIYENWDSFYKNYIENIKDNMSCCMCTIQNSKFDIDEKWSEQHNGMILENKDLLNKESFLYQKDYLSKYIFSPYDIISREVGYMYMFLPKSLDIKKMEYHQLTKNSLESQLNVLSTRGTKKLLIFSENENTLGILKSKLDKIRNSFKKE